MDNVLDVIKPVVQKKTEFRPNPYFRKMLCGKAAAEHFLCLHLLKNWMVQWAYKGTSCFGLFLGWEA